MVQKTTKEFAKHGISLQCDIYADEDVPRNTPVFLYFHPGGLVAYGRTAVPPWLVQVYSMISLTPRSIVTRGRG